MNRAVLTSAKSGNPKDRERLLLDFDGLIRSIAKSYASRIEGAESLEDLIQVGRIGFLDALDRFDENIAPAFIPYAKEGVRMAIRDHLNKAMRLIRLPKSAIENVKVLSEAYSELQEEGEAMPQREKVLEKTGMSIGDFDIIEANEAFAAQSVAVGKELGFDLSKLNPNGGAIALGHPVGASGCRILVTLLHEMEKKDAKTGLATLCIGGGMGCAAIVKRD